MFSTPTQFLSSDPSQRCFVKFIYDGKPFRLYNGKPLGITCFPNRKKSLTDKQRELQRLLEATYKALQVGWCPGTVIRKEAKESLPSITNLLQEVKVTFHSRGWSSSYMRDMTRITDELSAYLSADVKSSGLTIGRLDSEYLSTFLDNYRSSARYYMNKRRNLSALFSLLLKSEQNPVAFTPTMKVTEVLNQAYTPKQLTTVLDHLRLHNDNLFLCAMMVYGTMLRPHREIRLLRRRNFDDDLNHILLAGSANKSGRIRRVPVPDFVRDILLSRGVEKMAPDAFIFTGTAKPLNADYFTTAWSRHKRLMLTSKIILPAQTLYSFRHSAAIYSFTDRQDIRLLQGLMGHATPDVTTKYLRSLGIVEVSKEDLPRLPEIFI
ncbi:tyrosine-type recombinase/integrase [Spirosoma spitsbergense]|uniref:tyrosine-type recombinase/integrase n=1 Tax=Spirosoma spitsbergense TaxID=431554 RepID=UPI000368B7A6|nr:tyrosine-type recombinase/integrase [Spirosoma spitsbergense]